MVALAVAMAVYTIIMATACGLPDIDNRKRKEYQKVFL